MSWLLRTTLAALAAALLTASAAAQSGSGHEEAVRLFEERKNDEARRAFEAAFKASPRDGVAAYYLGRLALRDTQYAAAADWFERAVAIEPRNSEYHFRLGQAYGSQARRASKIKQVGLAKKTKAEFERAVALDPENLDAREGLVSYYREAPGFLGGSTERAFAQAEEIRKRDAVRGSLLLGSIYESEKKLAEAERAYLAAAEAKPDSVELQHRLGVFYQNSGQFDRAFALYDSVLERRPDDLLALYQIGRAAVLSGQHLDRGEQALQTYLSATPGPGLPPLASAHWRLGMLYERKGDRGRARASYDAALRLDPSHKEAREAVKKCAC